MPEPSDGLTDVVNTTNVNLSNCDRELIHIPGLIQPHGVMLVLRPTDLAILQASENTATLFGIPALQLHLKRLADLLGPEQEAALCRAIVDAGSRLDSGPLHLLRIPPVPGRIPFDAIAHRADGVLILELEGAAQVMPPPPNFYTEITPNITELQATTSLNDCLDLAVAQIRAFSGFDHVMAYRFAGDGSGEVVAEARQPGFNAYLGQHFPASDIPAPARRLFALSWLRHLPEVNYVPVRLLPEVREQVDMSRAVLRHVSVMYSSYLKNMGVHATMVMPLMKAGRLWGLISCMHHGAPLHVPHETRAASELLAIMVSLILAEKENLDTAAYRKRMSEAIEGLIGQMSRDPVYHRSLCAGGFTLDGWLDAHGVALVTESGVLLFGKTPTEDQVHGLVEWLSGYDDSGPVFATDRLSQFYPPAEKFRAVVSGLLAAQLVPTRPEFVMWFRPELVHVVHWAGDPTKPVQVDVVDGEARLTPRGSFELWKETVSGLSEPWLECEIEAATALRRAIAEVILVQLNEDLRHSNAELDGFAYAASHDMKEPLRGINNFARFLQQSADQKLTEEERGRIETIIRLTRRMNDLIEALLEYSRVGRTEFVVANVDLNELLKQTLDLLEIQITETGTVINLPRQFPSVRSNHALLGGIFANLIGNALKYNVLPKGQRQIEIGWQTDSAGQVFYVRDNGIGIAGQHLEHVFRIFRRLHARDEFGGGSGVGLTIARRSVERLGGRLWAESLGPGEGTTFLFTLGGTSTDAVQS